MPATLADIQAKYGDSVYPLYKDQMHEPYMETDTGRGYMGVVMYNELEDKVMCNECGEWFKKITSQHLKCHLMGVNEYRDRYGLFKKTPLCSKSYSEAQSKNAYKHANKLKPFKKGHINVTYDRSMAMSLVHSKFQSLNNRGLCDAQIASRLVIAAEMLNKDVHEIESNELSKVDYKLYQALKVKYGTVRLAAKALGIKYHDSYTDAKLIADLRKYVMENKKIPTMTSLHKKLSDYGLADIGTYIKFFGSWRRAKMMAGLDQLLEEIKNEV